MIWTTDNQYNWPNILTLIRIVMIPLLVVVYYLPVDWAHAAAAVIFALASITDWLDGYLARWLKQTTKIGAFLDPVADKLMVSVVLVLIVAEPTFKFISTQAEVISLPAFLLTVPASVIVARELVVSALREWMAELGKRTSVAVSSLGKIKTAVQMVALTIMVYCTATTPASIVFIGLGLLYVAAVLTIWSMCIYLKAAFLQIRFD